MRLIKLSSQVRGGTGDQSYTCTPWSTFVYNALTANLKTWRKSWCRARDSYSLQSSQFEKFKRDKSCFPGYQVSYDYVPFAGWCSEQELKYTVGRLRRSRVRQDYRSMVKPVSSSTISVASAVNRIMMSSGHSALLMLIRSRTLSGVAFTNRERTPSIHSSHWYQLNHPDAWSICTMPIFSTAYS